MLVEIDADATVTDLEFEKIRVSLAQFAYQLQAARGYRSEALAWQEMLEAGASRIGQLHRYKIKRQDKAATFRPYAPLKVSATERGNVKRAAVAEGVATMKDLRSGQCSHRDPQGRRCLRAQHFDTDHKF